VSGPGGSAPVERPSHGSALELEAWLGADDRVVADLRAAARVLLVHARLFDLRRQTISDFAEEVLDERPAQPRGEQPLALAVEKLGRRLVWQQRLLGVQPVEAVGDEAPVRVDDKATRGAWCAT
jgi:hypothetical protein